MLAWPPPRQARVQTRCSMGLAPGAYTQRAVANPDAGGCWRNAMDTAGALVRCCLVHLRRGVRT